MSNLDYTTLIHGDCIEEMKKLADENIKVDMVLADPPYGKTVCKWDTLIPLKKMWQVLDKIKHPQTPILLFGSQPFTTVLNHSNLKDYRYEWIWDKRSPSNPYLAKKQPMKYHEIISVFYKKQPKYNYNDNRVPKLINYDGSRTSESDKKIRYHETILGHKHISRYYVDDGTRYARSVITHINSLSKECNSKFRYHPSQKPLELLEYFIRSYTNIGDCVLDFCMGSGSTGVACKNLNRKFIGIEKDGKYYKIACERINNRL